MSCKRTLNLMLTAAVAMCLIGLSATPAMAAPSTAPLAADQGVVDRAVVRYQAAQAAASRLDARVVAATSRLDDIIAEETRARDRLRSRALAMYRTDDIGFVSALLGASSVPNFVARWETLTKIAEQDAKDLRTLKVARAKAQRSAEQLLELQAEKARALDVTAREVSRAKQDLASSQAALRQYEARIKANAKRPAQQPAKGPAAKQPTGSGAWQTAVASHYGRNFTGRGASGTTIGPYSMIVAHKTLPFGTLIEFEYGGKRAVASVADRGPYTAGRTFDLGPGLVRVLDFSGVHQVRYRIIGR